MITAPPPPRVRLSVGITGHRDTNAAYAAHRDQVREVIENLFDGMDRLVAAESGSIGPMGTTRLHSLLVSGTDQVAADGALRRGWELVAPLPFGRMLNLAINAHPATNADAEALLGGREPQCDDTNARAGAIARFYEQARTFELADKDEAIRSLFLHLLANPEDQAGQQTLDALIAEQVRLAGRVMIEQSDLIIAVWDGVAQNLVGGTGHTISAALELGIPVIWIDPKHARSPRFLRTPESLIVGGWDVLDFRPALGEMTLDALRPGDGGDWKQGASALGSEAWHARSSRLWTGYRRVEALFGGEGRPFRSLVQKYETPDKIGSGSGAPLLAAIRDIACEDPAFADRVEEKVMRRFAWADGISARLSDSYRGGMIANFMLSTLAVAAGIAYQPLGLDEHKWLFALTEFLLLTSILIITGIGGRLRWHKRWFETRRVAEYLRHAPILQLIGVARPTGRWPKGTETSWPEYYARHGLRALGLPQVKITSQYLRQVLERLLDEHVGLQRDYHIRKAQKLTRVHHRLDRLSERLFRLAVLSVSAYLLIAAGAAIGVLSHELPHKVSKLFTFLGVLCPAVGASIAGMRYFGDFERFAAISEVTAEKLDNIHRRMQLLLTAPDGALDYARASELAHLVDDIVIAEIENWQSVFGGKVITVPV